MGLGFSVEWVLGFGVSRNAGLRLEDLGLGFGFSVYCRECCHYLCSYCHGSFACVVTSLVFLRWLLSDFACFLRSL